MIELKKTRLLSIALLSFALFSENTLAGDLPDKTLTPGVMRKVDVHALCHTKTKLVRFTSAATKRSVYEKYEIKPRRSAECTGIAHNCFQIDHKYALENGGADDIKNLWPQLYDGEWNAHQKDKLENLVHRKICLGEITILEGQKLLDNWTDSYTLYFIN